MSSTSSILVMDHARLRYIERVLGIDLAAIDRAILEPIRDKYDKLGPGLYPIGANCKAEHQRGMPLYAVCRKNCVVSVVPLPPSSRRLERYAKTHYESNDSPQVRRRKLGLDDDPITEYRKDEYMKEGTHG